jgi:tetratricopeptide (TPR) repeat protein
MKKIAKLFIALCIPVIAFPQSAKVQTAYRNLQDYETSKDVSSLIKAKEAIDLATNHPDTKDKAKTWVYASKVYYDLFKNDLDAEAKKLSTVTDKNERMTKAYGAVSTVNYEEAGKAVVNAVTFDKDKTYQAEIAMISMQMMNDVNNLAVGKYNAGKYKEAMEYFENSYEASKAMGKKDTSQITNALICAQKDKDKDKIIYYNQKAITEGIATGYNYGNLFDIKMEMKDSATALKVLTAGRAAFPNDVDLMNRETDYLMSKGKNTEALANLDKAIAKDPKNAKLYLAKGITYYGLANPKDATGKKELDKPKDYDDLMGKGESNYKKSTEIDPKLYESWYNLGTLYNNWSTVWTKRCDDLIKQATKLKECEAKSNELLNKAIPAFEKAIEINPNDKATMAHLNKLYLITNQPEKAEKMRAMMKK